MGLTRVGVPSPLQAWHSAESEHGVSARDPEESIPLARSGAGESACRCDGEGRRADKLCKVLWNARPAGTAVTPGTGSFPRLIPGLRLNLAVPYVRPFMKLQERYGSELPQSVIDRNAHHPRFRQLVGLEDSYGWKEEGPRFLDPVNGGFKEDFVVNREANSTHYA